MVCDFFTNFAPIFEERFQRASALLIIYRSIYGSRPMGHSIKKAIRNQNKCRPYGCFLSIQTQAHRPMQQIQP